MKNKESGKGVWIRRSAIFALVLYSAVGAAILLAARRLIPVPLAEYIASAYIYGRDGSVLPAAVFAALYAAALTLCVLSAADKFSKKLYIAIPALILTAADLALHMYAFLASSGYQWNYMISAVLDAALGVCVLSGLKRDGRKK